MSLEKIYDKIDELDIQTYLSELEVLHYCSICPRECGSERFSDELGYCNSDSSFSISTICNHLGEEPVISGNKGICNIFFTNCNLQCRYCQNYQISQNNRNHNNCRIEFKNILKGIVQILQYGMKIVGFVSPTHYTPQMIAIIKALNDLDLKLTYVYNSNGYDSVETLRGLEGLIDVYMPDFKYSDAKLGLKLSDVKDYPDIAIKALKEMYRQIGNTFITDQEGYAIRGILIRHLVLPGHIENSINALCRISREISPELHIALMSQYYPNPYIDEFPELRRTLKPGEYYKVVKAMEETGFSRGFVQEMSSALNYNPDFNKNHPFKSM